MRTTWLSYFNFQLRVSYGSLREIVWTNMDVCIFFIARVYLKTFLTVHIEREIFCEKFFLTNRTPTPNCTTRTKPSPRWEDRFTFCSQQFLSELYTSCWQLVIVKLRTSVCNSDITEPSQHIQVSNNENFNYFKKTTFFPKIIKRIDRV